MRAGIHGILCDLRSTEDSNSQYDGQVERVPFSLTHDALPLPNWDD